MSRTSEEVAFTRLKLDTIKEKSCMLHVDYWAEEGMLRNRTEALIYAFGYFDGSGYDYKLSNEFLKELENKDYSGMAKEKRR